MFHRRITLSPKCLAESRIKVEIEIKIASVTATEGGVVEASILLGLEREETVRNHENALVIEEIIGQGRDRDHDHAIQDALETTENQHLLCNLLFPLPTKERTLGYANVAIPESHDTKIARDHALGPSHDHALGPSLQGSNANEEMIQT